MPRTKWYTSGSPIHYVFNRGVGRMTWLEEETDYRALLRIVSETLSLACVRIYDYCVIPSLALSNLARG